QPQSATTSQKKVQPPRKRYNQPGKKVQPATTTQKKGTIGHNHPEKGTTTQEKGYNQPGKGTTSPEKRYNQPQPPTTTQKKVQPPPPRKKLQPATITQKKVQPPRKRYYHPGKSTTSQEKRYNQPQPPR
uniref:Uncharacterized protein n=1 Tax=Clytia hemisphaerica TaxID=252671 RepID=A0A7M6DRD5_9CNID